MIGRFWREFRDEFERQIAAQRPPSVTPYQHASWASALVLMANQDPKIRDAMLEGLLTGTVLGACLKDDQVMDAVCWSVACGEILGITSHEAAVRLMGAIGVGVDTLEEALTSMGITQEAFIRQNDLVSERFADTTAAAVAPMDAIVERMRMMADVVRASKSQPDVEGG